MLCGVSIDRTDFMRRHRERDIRLTSVGFGKVRSLNVSIFTRPKADPSVVIDSLLEVKGSDAGTINSSADDS